MGKYDYDLNPVISVNFTSAIKQLFRFIKLDKFKQEKVRLELKTVIKRASLKMVTYQRKIGVNMSKTELLRDVAFLGTTLVELLENNQKIYKGVALACIDIVQMNNKCEFENEFILKIMKSKTYFFCNVYNQNRFQTEAFYLLFKSHFRIK